MSGKKRIMVMVPPAAGHVNPICGVVYELCKSGKYEIIFYSDEEYREAVEKTGARFRPYSHLTFSQLSEQLINVNANQFFYLLDQLLTFSYSLLPQLIQDVESDSPDLIIYDCFFLPAKYLLKIFKTRNAQQAPKSLMFFPNFAMNGRVAEMFKENSRVDYWMPVLLAKLFLRQIWFSWSYGLSSFNPFGAFMESHDELNIVAVAPEIQPYRDDFDSTFKFVGSCVSEEARAHEINIDFELKKFLEPFDVASVNTSLKLIYMSLGTFFNGIFEVFQRVIDAIREFNNTGRSIKSSDIRLVMSVGEKNMKIFEQKLQTGGLILPRNILVRAKVAQLEILKRSNLFISHCGMNSVSESIKYGVPLIGIPIEGDQHVVARRVCDELRLGVRIKRENLTYYTMADAIDRVLGEQEYRENVERMSLITARYKGQVDAAKLIIDHLEKS